MERGRRVVLGVVLGIGIGFMFAGGVQATLVTLSDYDSSDYDSEGASPLNVDWLDATVDFSVSGSTLNVDVTNLTGQGGDPAFNIAQIYFNAPDSLDDVGGLTLIDVIGSDPAAYTQWSKDTNYSENNYVVNGWGAFDVIVTDGGQHVIEPTETYTFSFSISGTETYTEADFGTLKSFMSPHGDAMEMLVAVKFVQGPEDISTFGAAVPEPATVALLGLGVLLFRKRRA